MYFFFPAFMMNSLVQDYFERKIAFVILITRAKLIYLFFLGYLALVLLVFRLILKLEYDDSDDKQREQDASRILQIFEILKMYRNVKICPL